MSSPIVRQEIYGSTPQDIMKINENTMAIFQKVFGDINFEDTANSLKDKISTQWIPVQSEGNLDGNYPMYCRFYIPPNTKKIKNTKFNFILERYRMDSGITEGGGAIVDVPISISTVSQSVSVSIGGGGSTITKTFPVQTWGWNGNVAQPGVRLDPDYSLSWAGSGYVYDSRGARGIMAYNGDSFYKQIIDLYELQHQHYVSIDTYHGHNVSVQPHNHSASAVFNVPSHSHGLTEGIRVSVFNPNNVNIYINDQHVTALNGDGATINDIDFADKLQIGQWNTIKVSSNNVARIVIYGIIELIQNYFG